MSNLRVERYTMPAANLGRENPLPMMVPRVTATAGDDVADDVPQEDRKYFGYGLDAGWLPYRGLDDYDRSRTRRDFLALILENEFLRATILPEVGGRLWSLFHKRSQRELLFVNPIFQPANLAVRGAWVAGGVEWNPCVYGHSPYNCSSLFAALVEDHEGGVVLRLYEWDRTRCVPYQLDFSLPESSPFLYVRVRLDNPHPRTIPMYWWSNIAVPESPDVRVLVPASCAYTYEYWGRVHRVPVPQNCELDFTYSTNLPYAGDYFFRLLDGKRPWIAALDGEGRGLIQTSTSRQVGRKLFAWGTRPGGRRWQEFLSAPDHAYFEIQAGLARTQLECLPMAAGSHWEWLEAYGLVEADPAKVHGPDWEAAVHEVGTRLDRMLPAASLEARLRETATLTKRPPSRILHRGSGWGALEWHRRQRFGESPFCSPGLIFDDESLCSSQAPWLSLLYDGHIAERDPSLEPGDWMIQPEWRELLADSARNARGDHWLTHLHLGLMHFAEGRFTAAEEAWQTSIQRRPSAWSYRNLAMLRKLAGDYGQALCYYEKSCELLPHLRPLLIEYCETLLIANRSAVVLSLLETLPDAIRQHSRVRLLEARAGADLQLFDRCQPILRDDYELVDIREGETSLTDVWLALRQANGFGAANGDATRDNPYVLHASHLSIPPRLNFQLMPDSRSSMPVHPYRRHLDKLLHVSPQ